MKKLTRIWHREYKRSVCATHTDWFRLYFPFVEQQDAGNEDSSKASASPGELAASLPDAPTEEPKVQGQPDSKKLKVNSLDTDGSDAGSKLDSGPPADSKSEDEWEDIKAVHGGPIESLHDDPVEVDRPSSATDVQSLHSSGLDDMVHSQSTDGFLGKD